MQAYNSSFGIIAAGRIGIFATSIGSQDVHLWTEIYLDYRRFGLLGADSIGKGAIVVLEVLNALW